LQFQELLELGKEKPYTPPKEWPRSIIVSVQSLEEKRNSKLL
jgi:hypothetical protein